MRKAGFNPPHSFREIIIAHRQRPDTMKMVRQYHPSVDNKRHGFPQLRHRFAKSTQRVGICQEWPTVMRDHREEK
jgi:hypothetical protein